MTGTKRVTGLSQWGRIQGRISDQGDLVNELDRKIDKSDPRLAQLQPTLQIIPVEVADNAVTDPKIGTRTADSNLVPSLGANSATLTIWLSWLTNRIRSINGTSTWTQSPPTNLTETATHLLSKNNPHNVTANQIGAIPTSDIGIPNGVAKLNSNGVLESSQIPSTLVNSSTLNSELSTKASTTALTTHTNSTNNPHSVTPEQIGAIALNQKGNPSGIASLDINSKVPFSQLPDILVTSTELEDRLANLSVSLNPATNTTRGTVKTNTASADPIVYLKADIDTLLSTKASTQVGSLTNSGLVRTNISVSDPIVPILQGGTVSSDVIPNIPASKITTGIIDPSRLGVNPDNTKFLRGDQVWVSLSSIAGEWSTISNKPASFPTTSALISDASDASRAVISATNNTQIRTAIGLGSSSIRDTGVVEGNVPLLGVSGKLATEVIPNLNASAIASGKLSTTVLPDQVLFRYLTVESSTERLGLTLSQVQPGDVVKETNTGNFYLLLDIPSNSSGWASLGSTGGNTVLSSGITDASATGRTVLTSNSADSRAALGLGSASTRNTGLLENNIPLLGTNGVLSASTIPSLDASKIVTGTIATERLGSGTSNTTTYLRGDQTWVSLGTAAIKNTGTSSGNVPELDVDSLLPASVIPNISAAKISSGLINLNRLGTGTPTASTFLRGDQTFTQLTTTDISGLGTASTRNVGTASGEIPVLDINGKLNTSVIPATSISEVFVVSNAAARLALSSATVGDVAKQLDNGLSYLLKATPASNSSNWEVITVAVAANDIVTGTIATERLGSGTANTTTYLRGDQTWASLGTAANKNTGTSNGNIPELDINGFVPVSTIPNISANKITSGTLSTSVLPPQALFKFQEIFSRVSATPSDVQKGDVVKETSSGNFYLLLGDDPSLTNNWLRLNLESDLSNRPIVDLTQLNFDSTSTINTNSVLPAGAQLTAIKVSIVSSFNGTPTISIGTVGNQTKYLSSSEVDLKISSNTSYEFSPLTEVVSNEETIQIFYTRSGATTGNARIYLEYVTPS